MSKRPTISMSFDHHDIVKLILSKILYLSISIVLTRVNYSKYDVNIIDNIFTESAY
ncbi:hypothetical protein SPSF3K_00027 [Streptococcus parauberis]|uniref:Uncharacterized protein n=2 Tax=Streptococcus parauberis TaxID=1348 RepID=A0AAE4HTY2_9STRE|nr:hypothetical protein [Streptococcus parauberis]AUT04769.1 hypothetical protein SPSF3K_00027 [Streptococcus parauberis]EMG24516.1 hypothetical protein SPJ1_2037 [Streptococcus parauberis KRS-02083]MDT2731241.1 hypothetical protein [Streptococcus parauberis]MDT2749316.1 hypothetical protein [Streptococcus parauberis]UWV10246.1 hypothetical protein N2A95_00130 [Streptococcus parauberis]